MSTTAPFLLIAGLLAQAPAPPADRKDLTAEGPGAAVARLEIMKREVMTYTLRSADDRGVTYGLLPEPVLRYTNPIGDTLDGTIFLWLDAGHRPAAASQVFLRRDGRWIMELTSLSTGLVAATSTTGREWTTTRAGVEFRPVPGSPKPAGTAERRLRQMRDLTREIGAECYFREQDWQPLRMLSRPFARYGRPDSDPIDGALFAYVLTTDPDVYLMLEARPGKDGLEWQYAFAPSTIYAVKGKVQGVEVWSLPYRPPIESNNPKMLFHVHPFQPGR